MKRNAWVLVCALLTLTTNADDRPPGDHSPRGPRMDVIKKVVVLDERTEHEVPLFGSFHIPSLHAEVLKDSTAIKLEERSIWDVKMHWDGLPFQHEENIRESKCQYLTRDKVFCAALGDRDRKFISEYKVMRVENPLFAGMLTADELVQVVKSYNQFPLVMQAQVQHIEYTVLKYSLPPSPQPQDCFKKTEIVARVNPKGDSAFIAERKKLLSTVGLPMAECKIK